LTTENVFRQNVDFVENLVFLKQENLLLSVSFEKRRRPLEKKTSFSQMRKPTKFSFWMEKRT